MSVSLAGLAASRALHRAYWFYRAYRVEKALLDLRDAVERKYNPDQPRVPAGDPRGGQWTAGGGGGRSSDQQRIRVAQNDDPNTLTDVPPRPRNLPRSIQSLSDIPKEKPSSIQFVNAAGKFIACEFADYIMKQSVESAAKKVTLRSMLRKLFYAAELAPWIEQDLWPVIESYNDPPKSLKELQDAAALGRRPGYEIHHIVEQNSKQLGEDAKVNSPDNLVSIPTFKHHLISGRFSRKRKEYGGVSLRSYLKDKTWEERYRIGLEIMVEQGILRP